MRRRRATLLAIGGGCLAVAMVTFAGETYAQSLNPLDYLPAEGAGQQAILLVALAAAMVFALFSTISLLAARDRAEETIKSLNQQIGDLREGLDRAEALVSEDGQRMVAWNGDGERTLLAGRLPPETGAPGTEAAFLDFQHWLEPASADRLYELIGGLRARAETFVETVTTTTGHRLEVHGWTTGSAGALRFRDLAGDRKALAELRLNHDRLEQDIASMRAMLSAAPNPVWLRGPDGQLAWVNDAFAEAVGADDVRDAVSRQLELFDAVGRQAITARNGDDAHYFGRLPAIVGGNRRMFEVTDVLGEHGSAGLAVDITEADDTRSALKREEEFNGRTLDQLQTAVAIFGPNRRLRSGNAAYRALFDLDQAFLDSAPDEHAILEKLRTERKLPEQADFRAWRDNLLSAYQSAETQELQWHLPDERTLRVLANPHPGGGMTWIYENVTEQIDLESRYNVLKSVQGETIDHLAEGVAVFGSNGRLRLSNPAFGDVLGLGDDVLTILPHVSDVIAACRNAEDDPDMWEALMGSIAGLDEGRAGASGRIETSDGRVIDYRTVPLPDGQTMATFVDVTDTVMMERALIERNDALEAADRLKNAFIRHVSYELRSPLTNIIGFAQLLADARIGPLNDKQAEYISYVLSSSGSLLAIINDILDLTTVDAGVMELDISEIGIAPLIEETLLELAERIEDRGIRISVAVPPGAGRIVADEKRIRQVLFNLIANAVEYSDRGGRVRLSVERRDDSVVFEIADEGSGIPEDFLDKAFERFSSLPRGASRGGAGLGLAIVKSFIDLHGGTVDLTSEEGSGTTARVTLPLRPRITAAAAE